ncbi:MAG: Dyp-type peroxidase domain-containing protein [Mycobacteriales bacterium]
MTDDEAGRVSRRGLLTGAGMAAAGAATGLAVSELGAPARTARPQPDRIAFHGTVQAGVTTAAQRNAAVVAFDVTAADRTELTDLMRTLTARARTLCAGGDPVVRDIAGPPVDSGVLGPSPSPDRLTVTVGVGASLFDGRYGLAARRPRGLVPMRTFPNDRLDPARCHGDLSVQICAESPDTVAYVLRELARQILGPGVSPGA